MLINRVKEEDECVNEKGTVDVDRNLEEYQTANELYDIMAQNNPHNLNVSEARDLVILYENIDVGTKMISSTINNKASNQYVETVIYNDDPDSEDSDVCEFYSNEDLKNIFAINNERIDLLNNIPSFENTLCHKFGNQHMKTSNFCNEYGSHFLFNDPFIKEQLQSLHAMTASKQSESAVLPMSLLDYICSKRVEENYNFYMDNIINYVQNTIEQLKRISNGDYLTDRVKEKWREVKGAFINKTNKSNKHIPLSSTDNSPLPIVGKCSNQVFFTWDEIVHSEMDIRCLSKILEKKIILEIPKLLCGSYKLFTKRFKDNFTLSRKRTNNRVTHVIKEKSSVDILVNLQRPEPGHMNRNMNSVIVLQSIKPSLANRESSVNNFVALHLKEIERNKEENLKIIELDDNDNSIIQENDGAKNATNIDTELEHVLFTRNDSKFKSDTRCSLIPADELGRAMHRLNIQSSVLEENEDDYIKKRRSPTRIRIKSPYENKSFVLDERKRKRLLEIRERREKKKLAMNENCKITKHKFVKGAVMAQSSNSVTKLSITNKSFYNSIYGHNNIANKNFSKSVMNESEKDPNLTSDIEECHEESKKELSPVSLGKNGQKYINRSYYLDDADTEIMYLQMKSNNDEDDTVEILTPSTSVLSSDVGAKLSGFRNFINLSTTDFSGTDTTSSLHQNILLENSSEYANKQNDCQLPPHFTEVLVPRNTPKPNDSTRIDKCKKITMSVECRKSIDKIYDLMKKITVSPVPHENKQNDSKIINNSHEKEIACKDMENVAIQENESGTSFKLQLTSSNPSSFGNENRNYVFEAQRKFTNKKTDTSAAIVPKVVISSKFQADKMEKINHKTKKLNKKVDSKLADNPLKAISQLLHEFDSVQKTRYKNGKEVKSLKKNDNINGATRQFALHTKVASCEEKNIKRSEQGNSRFFKPLSPTKNLKISQLKSVEEKTLPKKKLADFIDEVKEMRGEAVRGPSKRPILSSRIDNLAQPKRSYVKAHQDDFQNRFSRNPIPKGQKSPIASVLVHEKSKRTNYKNKHREGIEIDQRVPKEIKKYGPSLEKPRRTPNKSPVRNEKSPSMSANRIPNNCNDKNATHLLNNKMVAVETYVKSHFERVLPTRNQGNKNIVPKSRVPLIPLDIDTASLTSSPIGEESTSLGNKLHKMVNAKIIPHSLPLAPFSEYKENPSETDKDGKMESVEHLSKRSTTISNDYLVDIFEDKNIVTAVECVSKEDNAKIDQTKKSNVDMQSSEELNSYNVLQKLEHALYRQMSNGTFQKRLRLKNLTLTPKQSMQQVFLLHSGDAGSLIVKSKITQKLNFSQTDIIPKLDMLPIVSPNSLNLLPMQIATVGYVFPKYNFFKNKLSNKNNILDNKNFATSLQVTTSKNNSLVDKTVDCSKKNNERESLKQNTDQGIDMFNVNMGCSKESPHLLNENIEQPEIVLKEENIESVDVRPKNCDSINNSTSLDLLVRLLNEIKKISTCQNLITAVNDNDTHVDNKELKIILNKAGAPDNSLDHSVKDSISISSLDNQRCVHSSNFSLYWQSNVEDYLDKYKFTQDNKNNNVNDIQALLVDKEVNVQTSLKQIMHTFTDVPSRLFPSKVNRSTDVVRSLIATISKTSIETVCSFSDCHVLYSNSTFNNIKTWPHVNKTQSLTSSICKREKFEVNIEKQNKSKNILRVSRVKVIHNKTTPEVKLHDNSFNVLQEFDPLLKMKRDVLVTVYSILVFTVFAALTIPDIISHS